MWFAKKEKMDFILLSKNSEGKVLKSFVDELSFWGNLTPKSKGKQHTFGTIQSQQQNQQTVLGDKQPETSRLKNKINDSPSLGKPIWRRALDSATGRTYYYDAITRCTQWEKPAEIRAIEHQRRNEKKKQDRIFFKQMEQNIYQSLENGQVIPGLNVSKTEILKPHIDEELDHLPPCRARTLSKMEESLLLELSQDNTEPNSPLISIVNSRRDAHGRPPLPDRRTYLSEASTEVSIVSLELSPEETRTKYEYYAGSDDEPLSPTEHPLSFSHDHVDETDPSDPLRGEALLDGPIIDDADDSMHFHGTQQHEQPPLQPLQLHVRRNTGGTIYAESTMMNPDVEATIKCVCGVYRAHIVQSASKRSNNSPVSVALFAQESNHDIFTDFPVPGHEIPSLHDIIAFYRDFYVRSQMEHDTIIMSLIYVERLIKETQIAPVPENWQSILFSCMVLASKVWDDLSMWNIDFSNVCGRGGGILVVYTLPRINQLELALLKELNFNVKVPASEYAKYYFLIRSMLIKSGLLIEETQKTSVATVLTGTPSKHRNTRSLDEGWLEQHQKHRQNNNAKHLQRKDSPPVYGGPRGSSVSLEQLLSMTTF
mmetsp:Transcript_30546/g.34837  ORF Transcript_30546/g.34837 Transcript_30546/m.34837 type:complete len:597 (+) Transcript_30546:371-2161(+)|eukprot:CAMPEP_0194134328 /NCGR_PEP_ID=MMETSP0152-20130528/4399_1 /TAXON_ID=1049557 /ORGANISM="Thalassiothrix antarctica, Strain L6-D1" /LENGTH=596 /DNA_ID=CAMNT_0038829983 /DNA_START=295 /DNA_END=2085 /DNA_ORIENTATION=+